MLSKLSRSEELEMSRGIFQSVYKLAEVEVREHSMIESQSVSELPTVADLVLPGTGHTFSDEFACLLHVLCGAKGEQS
jgi:hypothetical protein